MPFFQNAALFLLILLQFLLPENSFAQTLYSFQNPDLPTEERITNLLSVMTQEEKIACLGNNTGIPRLKLNSPGSLEGLHGLVIGNHWFTPFPIPPQFEQAQPTQFPQAVGMAQTWNPALIQQAASAQGHEARYIYQNGKYFSKGLVVWAPNADLARDPRWGRTEESFGEDAYLTGRMAVAMVRGLQGNDPKYWQAAALLKHFMANSNEDTRFSSSSDFDERLMREYYSLPFQMAFKEAGARSYMAAYNAWNKTPMTIHPMLKNVLAKEWGADGIVSTDAGAMTNLVKFHKTAPDLAQAAAACIKAGHNQFLLEDFRKYVKEALDAKLISEKDIDGVLRGMFRTWIKLGILDPAERVPYASIGQGIEPWKTEKHKALAKQVALESIVLLKNQNELLPLDKNKVKSIAVIGPYADQVLMDAYGGKAAYEVSILHGIKKQLNINTPIVHAPNNDFDMAVRAAKTAEIAIVVVGNHPLGGAANPIADLIQGAQGGQATNLLPSDGREGVDRLSINLEQEELIKKIYAVNPKTIVVLASSFPYAINWTQANIPAIVHTTHSGQEQGNAVAEVLFGQYNPGGRLVHTWYSSLEQIPALLDYDIRKGKTYQYFKGKPLYAFGYGLSYTSFVYKNLTTSAESLSKTGELTVKVEVSNTGTRAGDEVVQLYVEYPNSKVARPVKQLVSFERVSLKVGETKTVELVLKAGSLGYWDAAKQGVVVESGAVVVSVQSSAAEVKLSKKVAIL